MSPRGGPRANQTGRPPRTGEPTTTTGVRLTESERAELTDGLLDGEGVGDVLREGGLRLVRSRRKR